MSQTIPESAAPGDDDWPDDLRVGAELIAGAVDPRKVLAFATLAEAQGALDEALGAFTTALGNAARILGLDLAETLALAGYKAMTTTLLAEHLAVAALAGTERGEP